MSLLGTSLFHSKENMGATHKLQTHTHMFTSLLQAQIYIYSPVHAHVCMYMRVCACGCMFVDVSGIPPTKQSVRIHVL